jgi:hypothetical protein
MVCNSKNRHAGSVPATMNDTAATVKKNKKQFYGVYIRVTCHLVTVLILNELDKANKHKN